MYLMTLQNRNLSVFFGSLVTLGKLRFFVLL